jgi:hypothetical protein
VTFRQETLAAVTAVEQALAIAQTGAGADEVSVVASATPDLHSSLLTL